MIGYRRTGLPLSSISHFCGLSLTVGNTIRRQYSGVQTVFSYEQITFIAIC